MSKLVSILVPAYNAQKWIGCALESALAQTWPNIEIVVVDDGSSDSTVGVARKYQSSSVVIETIPHAGASAARNRALHLAQGDYIQWLDADDYLYPDKVEVQMHAVREGAPPSTLHSGAWSSYYWCRSEASFQPSGLWQDLSPVEWLYRKVCHNLWMAPEVWLVSRELSEAAGSWDESLTLDDDGDYFSRVVAHASHIRFHPRARCLHRIGVPDSISSSAALDRNKLKSQLTSLRRYVALLTSIEDSQRSRDACINMLGRWRTIFVEHAPELVVELDTEAAKLGRCLEVEPRRFVFRVASWLFGNTLVSCLRGRYRRTRALLYRGLSRLRCLGRR